jgi:GT2 family glycosyltransferase
MPVDLPSVSIIVLNWNGKHHLSSCLTSLGALEYPESKLEVILCDNGSTDGSADFVRTQFPRVKLIALDRNYGFAEGNDRAAEQARGEWVGFLNNDMWVKPSWLKDMLSALEQRPEAACVASRIVNWDGSAMDFVGGGVNFMGQAFQLDYGKSESTHDKFRRLLFACGGAMLIRRDVFLEVGGFDRDFFAFFEDVDLGWRLNLLGHDVWYTPRATAFHRHHGTASRIQPQRLRALTERNALATIYKCFDDKNLAAALPAALMLLNERAVLMAKLDVDRFRMGAPSRPSFVDKVRRVVREEGWGVALRKAAHLTVASIVDALIAVLNPFGDNSYRMPGVTASHYVALSQFAHQLDALNEKRAWIQSHRRRSDAEIVPLFQEPFYAGHSDQRYVEFMSWLCRVQGLDRRFSAAPD